MASRPSPNSSPDDYGFPNHRFPAGPPSIISSRMTDIASEDGDENAQDDQTRTQRRSIIASESRPGTAKTGLSSRGAWSNRNSFRKGIQRGSMIARNNSISGSSLRPQSSASRSHVPSITPNAFFHPMSSQKLQAQRSSYRPQAAGQNRDSFQEDPAAESPKIAEESPTTPIPNPIAHLTRQLTEEEDDDEHPPPSRGTEITEPETYGRVTANTSPTQGHYPAASLSESMRPLQRKKVGDMGLRVDVDRTKAYNKHATNVQAPSKSPRSFRSNFMMPSKPEGTKTPHSMHGAEKLSSGGSSPHLTPTLPNALPPSKTRAATKEKAAKLGRNYEYFEGNTVFCLGGRLQNTRSRPINIATGFLVAIPAILFLAFSAPYLWHEVSPAVPIVFAYIFYICMSSFIRASVSDPGVSRCDLRGVLFYTLSLYSV